MGTMSVPFTYRQLEAFIAVARAGSIANGAIDLMSSPSAVSSAITELEKGLGVTLFERRRSKGMQLTTHGEHLRDKALHLLEDAQAAVLAVSETSQELHGTIRLGCYSSLSAALLPMILARFSKAHPHVNFKLQSGSQSELNEMFDKGEIDIALTYNRFLSADLKFRSIQRRYPYVLLAKGHPLARKATITLKELAEDNFILLDVNPSRENTLSWFENAGVSPKTAWEIKEAALARALVGAGLGYTILLQAYGHNLTVDGSEVVSIPLSPRPTPIDIFLAWRTLPSGEPRRIQVFIDYVTETLKSFSAAPPGNQH